MAADTQESRGGGIVAALESAATEARTGGWLSIPAVSGGLSLLMLAGALALPSLSGATSPEARRAFDVDTSRLAFELTPEWLEPDTLDEIRASIAALGPVSLKDDEALVALTERILEVAPWVAEVRQVEKRYPRSLQIQFEFREPVAVVESADGDVFVSADGRVLGRARTEGPGGTAPVRLVRPGAPPALMAGQRLADLPWKTAIATAVEVEPYRARLGAKGFHLASVDVTPVADQVVGRRTDVLLWSEPDANGQRFFIAWGRPRSLRADEPTAAAKIRNCELAFDHQPPFEPVVGICAQFAQPQHVTYVRADGAETEADTIGRGDRYASGPRAGE